MCLVTSTAPHISLMLIAVHRWSHMLTVIIPAHNEQDVIADCLNGLLVQRCAPHAIEIIVCANGCVDNTVQICQSYSDQFAARGIAYQLLQTSTGNKNNALNIADSAASNAARLYLDADVICSPELLQQSLCAIDTDEPVYFSGTLSIPAGASFFSNAYGKIWSAMPYVRNIVTGIGCYGVNKAGRALWQEFPKIHSDDKFVRLLFSDAQCKKLEAWYEWPVPQGLLNLIKIRTRWNKGNKELQTRFPDLSFGNTSRYKADKSSIATMLSHPLQTLVFLFVYGTAALLASLSKESQIKWIRAR